MVCDKHLPSCQRTPSLQRNQASLCLPVKEQEYFRSVFATSMAFSPERHIIERSVLGMTDLFSIDAIQAHFSQFTLQKRRGGQMLTKEKEDQGGGCRCILMLTTV